MPEPASLIWIRRVEALETSQRRLRWGKSVLFCFVVALAVAGAGRLPEVTFSSLAELAEASTIGAPYGKAEVLPALRDQLYDEFLKEFKRLRENAERRQYLTAQVLTASAEHHVDPDLLFALIAVESRFDSKAVSPKGARGLGQMMFRTARSVAPREVRRPEDLHDVPRNLYATALHLRQLMDEGSGDLREALRAYHGGSRVRSGKGRDSDQYVARVSTYYAYLKGRRTYRQLAAAQPAQIGRATN